jgi:hypothetical protein
MTLKCEGERADVNISAGRRRHLLYLEKKRKEEVGWLGGCLNPRGLEEGMRLLIVDRCKTIDQLGGCYCRKEERKWKDL